MISSSKNYVPSFYNIVSRNKSLMVDKLFGKIIIKYPTRATIVLLNELIAGYYYQNV